MAHEITIPPAGKTVLHAIMFDVLPIWYRNMTTRRALARLASMNLRDIGLTEAQREAEIRTPFWR